MARTLSSELSIGLTWNLVDTLTDSTTVRDYNSQSQDLQWATGTGAAQNDTLWHSLRTLSASTAETLDLTNLTESIFGTSVVSNFAHVKGIAIFNKNTVSGDDLTVGAAASTPFTGPLGGTTPTLACKAGSPLVWADQEGSGWATSGANNLKINNGSSHSVSYEIMVWGTST